MIETSGIRSLYRTYGVGNFTVIKGGKRIRQTPSKHRCTTDKLVLDDRLADDLQCMSIYERVSSVSDGVGFEFRSPARSNGTLHQVITIQLQP